jgi:hybrid cluster-associated redox disulfide protein
MDPTEPSVITPDLPMSKILEKWPETIPVFIAHGFSCVGCYMSAFDTLGVALAVHGLHLKPILVDLNQSIAELKPDK